MRPEDEARHDPELAGAPAAAGPVEIRMLRGTGEQQLSAGGDDLQRAHVVASEAPGAARESVPSAERQARDSDGRARPCGNRDAFLRKPLHDVDEEGARTDRRRARRVVDADSVHPRDVDDDATASRVARIAVPAGPGHHANRVPPRPAHGTPDILRGVAEHDRSWPDVVEAGAVEAARRVVRRIGRRDNRSLHQPGELDEPRVDRRARAARDPAWDGSEGACTQRQPAAADEQLAPIEPLTPGVRHRNGSVTPPLRLRRAPPGANGEPQANRGLRPVSETRL